MLENGRGNCESGMMSDAQGDTSMTPSEKANTLTYKLVQVEGDGSFFSASEDDLIEVEHLLAEPRNDKVLVDSILCFNPENPEKCLQMEDFPCTVDYDHIRTDNGTLDSNTTIEGKEESKFEFLDGMLHGVDGVGDLHMTNGLSAVCDDYLLDAEFAERVSDLDYGPCEGSRLGNIGLESHTLSGRNSSTPEISELSTATIPVLESAFEPNAKLLDKMNIHELHEAFRSTFGRETSVMDKQWLKRRISFGLHNLVEFENVSSLLESEIYSNENEGDMIFGTSNNSSGRMQRFLTNVQGTKTKSVGVDVERKRLVGRDGLANNIPESGQVGAGLSDLGDREGPVLTRKRLRKPTQRYIEESSALKSRFYSGRLESPTTSSKDKFMQIRSHNQHHRKGFGAMPSVSRQDYLGGSGIQVPFGLRVRKGRPKKNTSISGYDSDNNKEERLPSVLNRNSDMEPSAESQDDQSDDCVTTVRTVKGGMRRKHHRLWTLSEVMKLIDGVSQYGVGRWTEIKRLLFSSSAYRTSVDLKDKWRNLLRASCAQLQNKKEVEPGRKHASRPIPQSVLRRVNELAIIYPYPRQRKSKLTHTSPIVSPITSTVDSGTPISRSGRIVHRKNFT